ncbi:adhesion protein FadA [Fusobacterium periodonticum]|uniref:adhesion protein FadA n=1 Tax=Fusobacterium periodonticum TaxID=860 RepID=UPI0028D909F6|nr:adhesion protein FadA [Fusobacterium periodonticum]
MKKFFVMSMILAASLSYGANENITSTLQTIESKYNDLIQKEEVKKREFKNEKARLEKEIVGLKEKEVGKEEKLEKLRKDSEVRWHRDDYKKLLNEYELYYKNLTKEILDRESKVEEINKLLSSMQ